MQSNFTKTNVGWDNVVRQISGSVISGGVEKQCDVTQSNVEQCKIKVRDVRHCDVEQYDVGQCRSEQRHEE